MNVEDARLVALRCGKGVEEVLFVENWVTWTVGGKWFMLMQLDAPEPRVAVKLSPERGEELREHYDGVRAAYHMNKRHWSDLYLEQLPDALVEELIGESYRLVYCKLPLKMRKEIEEISE